LKSQIATSGLIAAKDEAKSHGGRRKLPMAFTEHGAIMAATVLSSPRAVEVSVYVVRAFLKLRELMASAESPPSPKRPIGFVHPQDAAKPKVKAVKASAAKKTAAVKAAGK
jgi:hypothetical protein